MYQLIQKKGVNIFSLFRDKLDKTYSIQPNYYWLIHIIFVYLDSECLSQYTFQCNILISFIVGKTLIFLQGDIIYPLAWFDFTGDSIQL